jgi:hypothetical protein
MAERQRVFKQGHLDGLCGIYAIVHVLTSLLGPLFDKHNLPRDVFREAARGIPRSRYPSVLWNGTTPIELLRAAEFACRWVERETGLGVDVTRPFLRKKFASRDAFFDHLLDQRQRDRGSDFILWIDWPQSEGGGSHWSVFAGISDTHLRLLDSGNTARRATKRMTVSGGRGLNLNPRSTIMFDFARLNGEARPRGNDPST